MVNNKYYSWLRNLGVVLLLSGCGSDLVKQAPAPLAVEDERKKNFGEFFGPDFLLFGGQARDNTDNTPVSNVNNYLWKAALEALAFWPLTSTDAVGGVIISDWYTRPSRPNERLKMIVKIAGKSLRADALNVTLYKQVRNKAGQWVEHNIEQQLTLQIEDIIIAKAKELRAKDLS